MKRFFALLLASCVLGLSGPPVPAADWPTLGHDNQRTHATTERLPVPLRLLWSRPGPAPQPAWPGPAKWDAYARIEKLASMRNFDPAYFVVAADDRIWFGSSADDAVHCLDARTGDELWAFVTGGPVRLPPSYLDGRVYAGSDDGVAYCLDARSGEVFWRYRPVREDRWLVSNGRLISTWPCRTGILLRDGLACFGMSLLPWENSYLCAVDALTGRLGPAGTFRVEQRGLTMQGALTASRDRLFVSQGRQSPIVRDLGTGAPLGSLGKGGDGGVWGLVTPEDVFIHGRGQNHGSGGELRQFDGKTRQRLVRFPKARRAAVAGKTVYLLSKGRIEAFDWARYLPVSRQHGDAVSRREQAEAKLKQVDKTGTDAEKRKLRGEIAAQKQRTAELAKKMSACSLWRASTRCAHALIATADAVFVGGVDLVAAYAAATGERIWEASVDGVAYGLAAANGRLFVSTDAGTIHCFTPASDP